MSKNLSDSMKENLKTMYEEGKFCTDSDVEDFCRVHRLSLRTVYAYLDQLRIPKQCKGCCNAWAFPDGFPCHSCTRISHDYYNVDVEKIDDMINRMMRGQRYKEA